MDALGYEEHLDYDIAQSTNPDFNKAIVRVNVFRDHRQLFRYVPCKNQSYSYILTSYFSTSNQKMLMS